MKNGSQKMTPRSRPGQLASMLLTLALLVTIAGCRTAPKVVVIPADQAVGFAPAGNQLTVTNDVYLVPPARMQWILRQLSLKARDLESSTP